VGKGADVNAKDDIWYKPSERRRWRLQIDMVTFLIKAGAKDVDAAVLTAAALGNVAMVQAILDLSKVSQDALDGALYLVSSGTNKKMKETLEKAGAKAVPPASEADRKSWAKLVGSYDSDGGQKLTIAVKDVGLIIGGRYVKPIGPDNFEPLGTQGASYRFERKDGEVSRVIMKRLTAEYSFYRFKQPVAKPVVAANTTSKAVASPMNWPSFRGPDAPVSRTARILPSYGMAPRASRFDGRLPFQAWATPAQWCGNRVFLTTAISSGQADPKIRVGNYGDVTSVNDTSKHTWQVICLDRDSARSFGRRLHTKACRRSSGT